MTELLINHDQLLAATGCKTKESLEKILRSQKVRFLYGKNGCIFTTPSALDAAMGLNPAQADSVEIEFRR